MKLLLKNIFYSFPIQLFILHFRKYQVLLIFWYILFGAINSGIMKTFGADALFFAPEYLGNVDLLSGAIVGISLGIFMMSWNVTTFILHSKRCKFLATSRYPFLNYCINNAVLPLLFLIFYFSKLIVFDHRNELMENRDIIILISGILTGFIFILVFSFIYFFGTGRKIFKSIIPAISGTDAFRESPGSDDDNEQDQFGMKVSYYFTTHFNFHKKRNVAHYSQRFLDSIFKQHHFAAIISIMLAFFFLIGVGFFLDHKSFQIPAAASILIFFALMVAVIGGLTYFLQSWSLLFVVILLAGFNYLYRTEIIDPRNKAYGINYTNRADRPDYSKSKLKELCAPGIIAADKTNMISILENWKKKQHSEKPVMIFINVSGGGLRSATFVMNTLQQLDRISNGKLMQQTMLISGSSGGMLAATYYRELYRSKFNDTAINLHDPKFTRKIAEDLLNPVFSSLISRDIFAPAQKFTVGDFQYVKDRGYSFEEKLSDNTDGLLDKQLIDYVGDEKAAKIPLVILNSAISRDARKLMISSQPLSFMMKPVSADMDENESPDAVDFAALFAKQDPLKIRLLTALRMNATFPYVLPNVWLPSRPVIDVMDAGLRDNFGLETSLRFIDNFKDWIRDNTGGIIMLQMRDRMKDNWQDPMETVAITDILLKPGTMLQHNWQKLQDYYEKDAYHYFKPEFNNRLHDITFMYMPQKNDKAAALNFHLTAREKRDVVESFNNSHNQGMLKQFLQLIK